MKEHLGELKVSRSLRITTDIAVEIVIVLFLTVFFFRWRWPCTLLCYFFNLSEPLVTLSSMRFLFDSLKASTMMHASLVAISGCVVSELDLANG